MPVNLRRSHWQEFSVWPRNVDVKSLYRGAQPPDDFTEPQRVAQERHPAIFRLAYRAKRIADVGLLLSVQSAFRSVRVKRRIHRLQPWTRSDAQSLALETFEGLAELRFIRMRQPHAA